MHTTTSEKKDVAVIDYYYRVEVIGTLFDQSCTRHFQTYL